MDLFFISTKRMQHTVFVALCAIIVVIASSIAHANTITANHYQGFLLNPVKSIKSHTLLNHRGEQVEFPSANGKYQLIFFGYVSCPDVCPTTLLKIKQVIQALRDEERVEYNFVSIDVERDKPGQLKEFVTFFDPRITGFTGNIHNIKAVEKEFGILTRKFQGTTAFAYKLEHSVFMYLVDPDGKLLLMYPGSSDARQIVGDLNLILYK